MERKLQSFLARRMRGSFESFLPCDLIDYAHSVVPRELSALRAQAVLSPGRGWDRKLRELISVICAAHRGRPLLRPLELLDHPTANFVLNCSALGVTLKLSLLGFKLAAVTK